MFLLHTAVASEEPTQGQAQPDAGLLLHRGQEGQGEAGREGKEDAMYYIHILAFSVRSGTCCSSTLQSLPRSPPKVKLSLTPDFYFTGVGYCAEEEERSSTGQKGKYSCVESEQLTRCSVRTALGTLKAINNFFTKKVKFNSIVCTYCTYVNVFTLVGFLRF